MQDIKTKLIMVPVRGKSGFYAFFFIFYLIWYVFQSLNIKRKLIKK